ncbi:hypothetical protein FQN55_000414 [Onygenales sp. PD_40]|nr:hypothetical protein FQN55_000414 [Onygenales sp. PD_40]
MGNQIPGLPSTSQQWHQLAQQHRVESISIQELETLNSASKIEEAQFLALRVLWKRDMASDVDLDRDYGIRYRAEDIKNLKWNKHWMPYVQEVAKGLKGNADLGTFDTLYDFQQEIDNLQPGPQETKKVFFNVITRRQRRAMESNTFPPSTPTRGLKVYTSEAEVLDDMMAEVDIGEETPSKTPQSVGVKSVIETVSPVTTEEAKFLPLVKDEQIVNTALILLLRGLCLRMPGLAEARWSIERKAFHFRQHKSPKKESLYEARTDGHFSLITKNTSRSLSILEVKAQIRQEARPWM